MVAPPSIRGAGAPGQPGAQKREPTDLRSPNPRSTRGPSATVGPAPKKTRGNGDGHGRLRYTERSGRVAAFRTASHRESGATQTFLTYSPRLHATSHRCDGWNPLRACEDLASESMGGGCQEEPDPPNGEVRRYAGEHRTKRTGVALWRAPERGGPSTRHAGQRRNEHNPPSGPSRDPLAPGARAAAKAPA